MDNRSVFGIFVTSEQAQMATRNLVNQGFRPGDVSLLVSENTGDKDFATRKETKAPEGAVLGGLIGMIMGAFAGWVLGAGMVNVPDLIYFTAVGPMMSSFAGIGIGSVVGGLAGGLIGSSIPEYVATRFSGIVREGKILLSVHCDTSDWTRKAKTILADTGGSDIAVAAEKSGSYLNDHLSNMKPHAAHG